LFFSKPILKHWACCLVICERFQRTKIYFSLEDILTTMQNLEQYIGQQVYLWALF
jgi:glutaredoxin-related protein